MNQQKKSISMESSDVKIMIVEDDGIIAEDLMSMLKEKGFAVCGVAHTGMEALDLMHSRSPSFAILDIDLGGGMSGLDVAKVIHEKYTFPYVFLTSFDDDVTLEQAQNFGPYGYIVKPYRERTLLATIKTAMYNFQKSQKEHVLDKARLEELANQNITGQEFKIIIDLSKGFSYKQIADTHFISVNTVKYHAKNIYTKFDVSSRAELVAKIL